MFTVVSASGIDVKNCNQNWFSETQHYHSYLQIVRVQTAGTIGRFIANRHSSVLPHSGTTPSLCTCEYILHIYKKRKRDKRRFLLGCIVNAMTLPFVFTISFYPTLYEWQKELLKTIIITCVIDNTATGRDLTRIYRPLTNQFEYNRLHTPMVSVFYKVKRFLLDP